MENKEQKDITISSVIECLNKGMKRAEIAEHFGISKKECALMFQNPKLKGLKPRDNSLSFNLIDDTEEMVKEEKVEEDAVAPVLTDDKTSEVINVESYPPIYETSPTVVEEKTEEVQTDDTTPAWGEVTA